MIEKYIDLSKLNTISNIKYGEIIDWKHSVGIVLDFKYKDVDGKVSIVEYIDGNHLKVKINDKTYILSPQKIKKCNFGDILGFYNCDYLYSIGDVIRTHNRNLKILDRNYKAINNKGWKRRIYKYECLDCGNIDSIYEHKLEEKHGCSCCANQKIVIGINDMWTTAPEIAKLLKNPEDGYYVTKSCNKKMDWKCPICGNLVLKKSCNQVYRNKNINCPKCSDGISYPNKFMYNLLTDIGETVDREVHFQWLPDYPYDIVVEDKKVIIEMDGELGHGNKNYDGSKDINGIRIDKMKDDFALQNGYKIVRIDSNYDKISNRFDYIKNNILHSELINLFNSNFPH